MLFLHVLSAIAYLVRFLVSNNIILVSLSPCFLLHAPKQCLFSSLSVLLHLQTAPCETSIYPARSSDGYNTFVYEIDIYE